MAISKVYRTPYGAGVVRYPYWHLKGTDLNETVLELTGAQPAWFLPVLNKDSAKQLPVVLWPGTLVGMLNGSDQNEVPAAFRAQSPTVIVPAHGHASGYTITYTAMDLATDEYGGTYDIDEASSEVIVAAAGASTTAVDGPVNPLGIVQEPVFSQAFFRRQWNFQQQHKINILSAGAQIRIPCITDEEILINEGDKVMVSDGASSYDPVNNPGTSYPGRWKKADASKPELWVGTCVGKHKIVSQTTPSTNQMLLTAHSAGNLNPSTLNQAQGYHTLLRVQTVPGIPLQGSGTGGVPTALTFARADASGDFWAIDVALRVMGV